MLNLPFELIDEIFSHLSFEDKQNLTLVRELSAASSCRVLETMSVTDFDKDGISILTSPRVIDNVRCVTHFVFHASLCGLYRNLTVNCEYSLKLPRQISKMKQLLTLQLDLRFISHQMELFSKGGSIKPFGDLSLTTFLPASNTITGLTLQVHSTNDIHCDRIVLDELILRYPSLKTLAVVFEKQSEMLTQDIEPVVSKLAALPLSVVAVKWQKGSSYDKLRVLSADRFGTLRRVAGREERVRLASTLFHFKQIAYAYGY